MSTHTILRAALVNVLIFTAPAISGDLLWDNYPNGFGSEFMPSQFDDYFPFECQTADDFIGETWSIAGVKWTGRFLSDDWLDPPDWNIIFYADAGEKPTGGPDDPTDTALALYHLTSDEVTMEPEGYFHAWSTELPDAFVTAPGERYWIVLQAVFLYPPQWCICEALDSQLGCASQYGFPMLDIPYWTSSDARDMCFRLFGSVLPPPCPADVNDDGMVDVLDLLEVLSAWGPCPDCGEDITGDGVVDVLDLLEVLSAWGPC